MDTPGGRRRCSPKLPPLQRTLPLPPLRKHTVASLHLPPIADVWSRRTPRNFHPAGTELYPVILFMYLYACFLLRISQGLDLG